MQTLSVNQFTRQFSAQRRKPSLVTDRGRVIGTWTPVASKPKPVDFAQRAREDCSKQLPFTGAQLLKESRKR